MNKPFLLVGAILSFVYAASLVLGGIIFVSLESVISTTQAGLTPDEYEILISLMEMFKVFGIVMLVLAALDLIAGFRLLEARKGNATKAEALVWAIYLYIGGQIITGVFATLGVCLKDFKPMNRATSGPSLEERIKVLEEQYHAGFITKEEYELRRAKIIESVQ